MPGVTVSTVTESVRPPRLWDVVATPVTVTSVVAPPSSSTSSRAPVATSSTFASSAIVEPAPRPKLVGLRVHLIPPGTVESDEAAIADTGAVWPNRRKVRPTFAVLESGSHVP